MATGTSEVSGTARVLAQLARPYDPVQVLAALVGAPRRLARHHLGAVVATSPEAEALLEEMPRILRSLAIATSDRPERCYGELRGPVLWSETMSSRSATAGDLGLFVCATTTKAFDNDANRVLKAAIAAIAAAAHDAEPVGTISEDTVKAARHNGQRASRLLEHQTLASVPVVRPDGRQLRRARAANRRGSYQLAIDMLQRAHDPLDGALVRDLAASDAVTVQHEVLDAALRALARQRAAPVGLRHRGGQLVAGPVCYDHLSGVSVGGRRVETVAATEAAVDSLRES